MEKLISDKFKELTENGQLDEIITKRVSSFIDECIKDSLSSYGDSSKAFKEKLNTSILSGFDRIDFLQYGKSITDLVEAELNKSFVQYALEPVKAVINNFTGALSKKEWKLSEIIERYIEDEVLPNAELGDEGEIVFLHEKSKYGTTHIGFDESDNKSSYFECKFRFCVADKGWMFAPNVDNTNIHPLTEMGLGGFELFLFKLYASKCDIILDYDDVETNWQKYEE